MPPMDIETKEQAIFRLKRRIQDLNQRISSVRDEYDHAVQMCTGRLGGMNSSVLTKKLDAKIEKLGSLWFERDKVNEELLALIEKAVS